MVLRAPPRISLAWQNLSKKLPLRAILFDAGATIPTSLSAGNGWTGTTWLYAWYKARGITFDKIHAWEPMSRQVNKSVLDPDFAAALNFYNRGCNGAEGHPDNPLTVIRQDGVVGLFGRGLTTKLISNGIQGAMFSVLWKTIEPMLFPKE